MMKTVGKTLRHGLLFALNLTYVLGQKENVKFGTSEERFVLELVRLNLLTCSSFIVSYTLSFCVVSVKLLGFYI